jgi:RNA polymerase sigma-70 factor (ECF subfamily)
MSPMADPACDFDALVAAHRRELFAHCYRMLGSVQDAEDALQEALLAAWRGLEGFEGRSSLRTWLYTVATNACLRVISRRSPRRLTPDLAPPREDTADLGEVVRGPVWVEPWLGEPAGDDPAAGYERREGVELAFIAALQHLPGTQRAVLIMREALDFSAAEIAEALETTPASVNSALQRAREAVSSRMPAVSQAEQLSSLGVEGRRELVSRFVAAWEAADLDGVVALLAQDARFTMPPLPAWFDGRENVARFIRERVFATPWRLRPLQVNGQLAFACYILEDGSAEFRLGAVNVLTLRGGRIVVIDGFLDPDVHRRMGLPERI